MMFFGSDDIDDKWELAVNYYRQGHLPGIHTLKVKILKLFRTISFSFRRKESQG